MFNKERSSETAGLFGEGQCIANDGIPIEYCPQCCHIFVTENLNFNYFRTLKSPNVDND